MKIPKSIKAVSAAAVLALSFTVVCPPVSAECANSSSIVITADKSSSVKKGWVKKNGKTYYYDSKGKKKTGWATIQGEKYYFSDKGVMKTGDAVISGKVYSFNKDGTFVEQYKDTVVRINNKNYPVGRNGSLGKNSVVYVGDDAYYVGAAGYSVSATKKIDGIKYIFDADYGVVGMEYTVQSEYGGKGRQQTVDQKVNFRDIKADVTADRNGYNVYITGIINNRDFDYDIVVSFTVDVYDEKGRLINSVKVDREFIQARGSYELERTVSVDRAVGKININPKSVSWRYDYSR